MPKASAAQKNKRALAGSASSSPLCSASAAARGSSAMQHAAAKTRRLASKSLACAFASLRGMLISNASPVWPAAEGLTAQFWNAWSSDRQALNVQQGDTEDKLRIISSHTARTMRLGSARHCRPQACLACVCAHLLTITSDNGRPARSHARRRPLAPAFQQGRVATAHVANEALRARAHSMLSNSGLACVAKSNEFCMRCS